MLKRSVGRPAKPKNKFFSVGVSPQDLSKTANRLASRLPTSSLKVINDLAATAASFQLMLQLQKGANLTGKGSGRRAKIHVSMLYAECALVHEKHSRQCANRVLKRFGGWQEENPSQSGQGDEIVGYVNAILDEAGIRLPASHRQQVRNSLRYLGISPLFHAVTR